MYTCPMHPEIKKGKKGHCPLCGMQLINKDTTGQVDKKMEQTTWRSYLSLIIVIGLILLTTFAVTYKDSLTATASFPKTISYFMIGFFLTFSGFKLMDLKGFAQGYYIYDLLAKRWFSYGYIYPFIELFFGLSMILFSQSILILLAEFIIMTISGIGVAIKLAKGQKFQCACLGTFLKVPLTKITLIEDFGMSFLSLILLGINLKII